MYAIYICMLYIYIYVYILHELLQGRPMTNYISFNISFYVHIDLYIKWCGKQPTRTHTHKYICYTKHI